jgi:hypothetical protein
VKDLVALQAATPGPAPRIDIHGLLTRFATIPAERFGRGLCDTAFVTARVKAWLFVLCIVAACGAAVWGVVAYRARAIAPAELIKRLPAQDALLLYIDFSALRRAGLLQLLDGSKLGQEPEYESFVRDTDFNYVQDLDSALAAFAPTGKYILAKGRFDWKALRDYVKEQHGECYNSLCQMAGSTADRKISFLPVQTNLMAMAVSPDATAALRMEIVETGAPPSPVPDAAVWLLLPPAILKSPDSLPDGTRQFAKSVEDAKSVTIGFAPEGNRLAARLNVLCRSDQDAALTAAVLTKITEVLRKVIAQSGQKPSPTDLSGPLTLGAFQSKGSRVFGYWPIERAFVEQVLAAR